MPWADFAAELRQRFEVDSATRPNLTAANEQIPTGAPVAFLCHENRDKPLVESLATELQTCGIKVWLDKQNLRAGDRWPELIPNVLEKQCDYVVVLQSPRMLDKPESYCFLEIDLAAKRQPKFFPGLRYVVRPLWKPIHASRWSLCSPFTGLISPCPVASVPLRKLSSTTGRNARR